MRATLLACGASALLTPLRQTPPARLARPPTALRAVPVQSEWTTWALLGTTGALGLYAEENSKLGAALSSNVVTMVSALVLANLGALPTSSPVYGTVVKKLVPLAVAALLFDADLDRVRREGRRLLAPFVVAALGTIAGTVVAWRLVPLQRGIPVLAARATMASALTARHIGGAVNYVSVAEYGGAAPELVAAVSRLFSPWVPELPPPDIAVAHRWGAAFPSKPEGGTPPAISELGGRFVAVGDYLVGPRVEGAAASAEAGAKLLIEAYA